MSTRTKTTNRRAAGAAALLALWCCLALAAPGWAQGGVVLWGLDTEHHGSLGGSDVPAYQQVVRNLLRICNRQEPRGSGILVVGADELMPDQVTAYWTMLESDTGIDVTFLRGESAITAVDFDDFELVAVASTVDPSIGLNSGLTQPEHAALVARAADLNSYINDGGTLFGSYSDFADPFGYLGPFVTLEKAYTDIDLTLAPGSNPISRNPGMIWSWHQTFQGFPSYLHVLAVVRGTGEPAAVGGCEVTIPPPCASIAGDEPICPTDGSGDFTYTFDVTNTGEETVHHLFLLEPTPPVTLSPNYFDFFEDPICSTEQPGCSAADATRTLTVTIRGATPGDSVSFLASLHDESVSECCSVEHTVELPDCECGQIVDDRAFCSLGLFPFSTTQRYNFTFRNLHPHGVDNVLIAPANGSQVTVSPNALGGLGLAAVPYTGSAGELTQTLTLTGPDAVPGGEVCLNISAHDDDFEECCSVERCFEVSSCWERIDDIREIDTMVSVLAPSFFRVAGIDDEGDDGIDVDVDVDGADELEVGLLGFEEPTPDGAFWRLAGSAGSGDLFALRVEDTGDDLAVVPSGPAGATGRFAIRHRGLEVAAGDLDAGAAILLPDDVWSSDPPGAAAPKPRSRIKVRIRPTLVHGKPGIKITITFAIPPAPVATSGGTGPVVGDELIFVFEAPAPAHPVIDRLRFRAAGIPEVVFTTIEGTISDCNGNGVSDGVDLADGTSTDNDGSGVPDECEVPVQPLDLSLDTAFSEADGHLVAPRAKDDDWRIVDAGGSSLPARRVANPNRAWNAPLPGSAWISLDGNRGASAPGFETLVFERCFCLVGGAHDVSLALDLFADDRATVFLNGEPIGGPGGAFNAAAPLSVRYGGHLGDGLFRAGDNCVQVAVEDSGGVVTGLDLTGRVFAEAGACALP